MWPFIHCLYFIFARTKLRNNGNQPLDEICGEASGGVVKCRLYSYAMVERGYAQLSLNTPSGVLVLYRHLWFAFSSDGSCVAPSIVLSPIWDFICSCLVSIDVILEADIWTDSCKFQVLVENGIYSFVTLPSEQLDQYNTSCCQAFALFSQTKISSKIFLPQRHV